MRIYFLFFVIILIGAFPVYSQRDYTTSSKKAIENFEKGYKQYNLREYDAALEFLDKAIKKDDEFVEAYIIKGQVFEALEKPGKALENYHIATGLNPDFHPSLFYSMGLLYQNLGEYEKAKSKLEEFLEFRDTGPIYKEKAKLRIESCNFAIEQLNNPVDFEPENLGSSINSEHDDYWPSISADGKTLVFTRLIPMENDENREREMSQIPEERRKFIEAMNPKAQEDFFVSYKTDTGWSRARNIGSPLNTDKNEGAQSLSADGRTMYFSACNRNDGKGSCDIYVSYKQDGEWSKPENLGSPVNTKAWESQPSISPDGKTLYFTSNRSGGEGKKDIWKSNLKDDSTWTKPETLGDSINTREDDMAPYIHSDNQTLYFSSAGWPGMGRLDLFKSQKIDDTGWSEPQNLGYPINTHKDEVGFIVNSLGTTAYYSSSRDENYGEDILKFNLPEEVRPIASSYMQGKVYDDNNGEPLKARFELISKDEERLIMESHSDNKDGKFLVSIPTNNDYVLNVSKDGYLFYSDNFEMKGEHEITEPFSKDIPLKPIKEGEKMVLRNVFYELDSYHLKDESRVELNKLFDLLKNNPEMNIEISGHTDSLGTNEYNIELSENRANSVYEYLIEKGIEEERLNYKGYGETQPVAPNETSEGRALNRRTEVKIINKRE
ncbi:MAG: OmpA family protein [Bacteroidales bacterium]